jgi:transcriptional regulator with XRE-family HTH domain
METIGQQLRAARERKKITIEAAAQATKIKGEHLAALEANQFDQIEAPVYTKGFIRIYARFLGVDDKPLVETFLRAHAEATQAALAPSPMPPAPIAKTAPPPSSESRMPVSPAAIVMGLSGVVGLLVVIWGTMGFWNWWRSQRDTAKPAVTTPAASNLVVKAQVNPYLQPRNISPAKIIEPPRLPVHSLTVRADEPAQVTVTVDGATIFRGRMPRNEVRRFDGYKSIKIRATDGNTIHAWYNQKDIGKLGRRGEQVERTF